MGYQAETRKVLADPTASYWLKDAIQSAMERDPVDAANDAKFLSNLLTARCNHLLNRVGQ
jgi:hypothetical protein